jgi:toxin CptA
MSIAVSATVRPSRLLLKMVIVLCAGVAAIGFLIATGYLGGLSPSVRAFAAISCVFAAVFGFYHGAGGRKPIHIDISGTGQFRLAEALDASPCKQSNEPHLDRQVEVVRLLDHSTIWPYLLLLRLQHESGKITSLPILPDCVSRDSFRALSVACLWIASRGEMQKREDM